MSLVDLMRRPEIRAAFDRFAMATRTPDHMRGCQILVPDAKGPRGLAGTAFDYLARAQIIRDFGASNIRIHEEKGTFARVEVHIDIVPLPSDYEKYLRQSMTTGKHELAEYSAGRGDLRRLANHIQDVAWAEMAFRRNVAPAPEFRPAPAISEELLRMLELLDPRQRFAPRHFCLLNPIFEMSRWVGGADADLVIDHALIDLKTTVKPHVQVDMLRQLAGYAALQKLGGIRLGDNIHDIPFQSVGLYFARYGKIVSWTMEELFPGDGFAQFCAVIEEVVSENRKRYKEMMTRIEQRQAEEEEQVKLARAKKRKKAKEKVKKRTR